MNIIDGRRSVINKFVKASPVFIAADKVPAATRTRYKKALKFQEGREFPTTSGSFQDKPFNRYLQSECIRAVGACEWPIDIETTQFSIGPFFSADSPLSHLGVDLHVPKETEVKTCEAGKIVNVILDRGRDMLDVWIYSSQSQIFWVYAHLDIEHTLRLFPQYRLLMEYPERTSFHDNVPAKNHIYVPVEARTLIGSVGNWLWHDDYYQDTGAEVVFGTKFNHLHLEAQFYPKEVVTALLTYVVKLTPDNVLNPFFLLRPLFPLNANDIIAFQR
jgi:hypothetical protein